MLSLKYLNILKAAHKVSPEALKKAYYMAALKFHPDKNPDNFEAEEIFKTLTQTYQELSNDPLSAAKSESLKTSISYFRKVFGQIFNYAFPDQGAHLIYHLKISPKEALAGCRKTLIYMRSNLKNHPEKVKTQITIPPKTKNQQRLKVKEQGNQMPNKKDCGHLVVVVHIQ